DEDRADAVAALQQGYEESGIGRRPLVRNTLLGAVGALGLPAVVLLRDLGPLPKDVVDPENGKGLEHTLWKRGERIVRDVIGTPILASELEVGDLVNCQPEILLATDE